MKKNIFILFFCLITTVSYSDYKITRGPNSGEIYFIGPTSTGLGLYRSNDFGESITCFDSINAENMMAITAGKTQGVIYYTTMQGSLFFSDNYGTENSWSFKNSGIGIPLCNSENTGFVFEHAASHSEDFGNNFINHTGNGAFGLFKEAETGFGENGYFLSYKDDVLDSLYFFTTIDNFNNVELINTLPFPINNEIELSRGNNTGEIFLANQTSNTIYFSSDFGLNFTEINHLNFQNEYSLEIMGGRNEGEIYILFNFINMMWQNAHIYILHSTDYGNTFEVYHPFSKGNEPVLANFSTVDKEVHLTTPVEFSNFSICEITEYQWDFENDGIIDSYDEFPTHIYQDTGYYSVKLSVVGQDSTNTFIKDNYIHVIDTITSSQDLNYHSLKIYPNPFNEKISIKIKSEFKRIEIYDLNGKSHCTKTLNQENKTEIIDLRKLEKGIYILKIGTQRQDITKKIIKI